MLLSVLIHPCASVVNSIGFEVPDCPAYQGLSGLGNSSVAIEKFQLFEELYIPAYNIRCFFRPINYMVSWENSFEMRKLSKEEHRKLMGKSEIPEVNQNHISLSLFDFNSDPSEISKALDLSPSSTGIKGESYLVGPPAKRIQKIREYSRWQYEWKLHTNEFIGDIIEKFIKEIIIPRKEKLIHLANSSTIQFQVVQYYYDGCNPGVHIEKSSMEMLGAIGASLDVDIYCLGE
jgi:Domain of unknown function (DUF4279)